VIEGLEDSDSDNRVQEKRYTARNSQTAAPMEKAVNSDKDSFELRQEKAHDDVPIHDLLVSSMAGLVNALEAKDPYTAEHSLRVSDLAGKIAEHRNGVSPEIKEIQMAGQLHDIGKVGTPERILRKPASLTKEEFDHIKDHPLLAEKILAPFDKLKSVSNVIRHHHERFDGKGYPDGLAGKDIPELSRILAIVDSYDAMTSTRPYRPAMIPETAMGEIRKGLGTQFDPEFGEIFIRLFLTGRIS
jgi:putative nucleotidyltransferase with HDIG domain